MATSPPTGTVTFLFTDIEGSTKMWERSQKAMQAALARHDEILREAIEERGGYVFKRVGDAFCCAFWTATDALDAALEVQRTLFDEEWQETGPLRVRMALHTGAAEERDGDYFGPPVNRVARLLSAAHGGQVLLSLPTQELVRDQLPAGTSLRDLGEHRLKDLFRPERIFQLLAPELPSEFPPLRTLDAYRNNLPLQPTPLVGREKEVSEVRDLLRSGETRLLTLTGPGGTGKTRLALQAAADLLDDFSDGTFFVPLATLTEAALFFSAVAETLGVRETGEQPLDETLKDYLSERRMLLLLDNFEQVLGAAPAVTEMLAGAPGLKVLATSRAPLGLYGEHEFPVPPLTLPDLRHPPSLERLTQYEAVGLFLERARAVKPDFAITNESAPAVAEICVRLDGLPLAIELAAARIKMLPPRAMLQRLSSRLKLLTGGARDLPERQRTLRATIEWSHALLDEGEQLLFARLAVFSGGRTLEAIEEICDAEGDLPVDTLEGVSSLLDKSLLMQEEGPNGEPRFVMLETIHEFAREKLQESAEAEDTKRIHAQYFLTLAEEADPELRGPDQLEWLERLEAEHDNMRAALSWALERKEAEVALRLGGALWWYWATRGYDGEGRRWLEGALAMDGRGSPEVRAMALAGAGALAEGQGDLDRAEEACQEGLELLANEASEAKLRLLVGSGFMALEREEHGQATQLFEESLALSREMSDTWWFATSLLGLGIRSHYLKDSDKATELYEESMDLFREQGDKQSLAICLNSLAMMVYSQSDLGRAAHLYAIAALHGPTPVSEAIEHCETIAAEAEGDRRTKGLVTSILAALLGMHGDFDRARRLSAEARASLGELGPTVAGASTSLEASRIEVLAGNLPAAELALRRDYEALTQLGERYLLSTVAGELARVLYAQGRLDEAEKCSRHAQELADPDDIASTTLWRTVQAKLLAQKGNRDAALILIGEAVDLLKRTDSVVAQAETLVDLAEVLRLAGRRKEADDVLEGAVELFEAKGNVAAVEALRVPAASS